jgi:hypothetical protein
MIAAVARCRNAAREERAVLVLLLVFIAVSVIGSIYKPDHDIRYWYYAFPALVLLAGRMMSRWTAGRLPGAAPALAGVLLVLAVIYAVNFIHEHRGGADALARIQALHLSGELHAGNMLFVGGPPYDPAAIRRQHTQRDWCYFHLGFEPKAMWWVTAHETDLTQYDYVIVPHSKSSREPMRQTGLQPIATTRKMILTRPAGKDR